MAKTWIVMLDMFPNGIVFRLLTAPCRDITVAMTAPVAVDNLGKRTVNLKCNARDLGCDICAP